MDLPGKTVKGICYSGASQSIRLGLQFIIGAILARLLFPIDFGLVGMVAVFSGVIEMFSELGLGAAVIQRKDVVEEHLSSVFWLNLVTGLILTLLMFALAPLIAYFYDERRLVPIRIVLGTRFFISSFGIVQRTLLTKQLEFRKLAVIEVVSIGVAGGTAILLALRNIGVWSLVMQSLVFSVATVALCWSFTEWVPLWLFRWSRLKELLGFGLNLLGFSFVNYFGRNLDNLLIGRFIGPSALGYYDRAYHLMLLPIHNITSVLGRVLFPALSAIQDDLQKVRQVYLRATRYISFLSFPIMLGLSVVVPELIRVVFGAKWERSIFLASVLCLLGAFQSIRSTTGWIYLSQGRTDLQLKMGIFFTSVVLASFFIGLRWNIEGVTIAYATANLLAMLPGFYIPFRIIGLKMGLFFRNFVLTGTASFVMAVIVCICRYYLKHVLQVNDIVILLLCTALGVISYLCLMGIWGRGLLREIRDLMFQVKG